MRRAPETGAPMAEAAHDAGARILRTREGTTACRTGGPNSSASSRYTLPSASARGIYLLSMVILRCRGTRLGAAAFAALALLAGSARAADWASRPTQIGGLTVPARATAAGVELSRGGGLFAPRCE